MDKFDCLFRAHRYEQSTYEEKDLEEFQGLQSKTYSPQGKAWLGCLIERQAHLSKRKQRVPVIFLVGMFYQPPSFHMLIYL